jgi:hypothetical protein
MAQKKNAPQLKFVSTCDKNWTLMKKIQEFIFQNLAKNWPKIMENIDRNIFIFGISKRIAQKSCNHKPTLGFWVQP